MRSKKNLDPRPIYYVYVLFDWLGVPRYIGKGKEGTERENNHEKKSDSQNWLKNEFIEQTWIMLEEIPKVIIRKGLTELEAFTTEIALIKAIGRIDLNTGPLTNMTNGGDGGGFRQSALSRQRTGIGKSNWWKQTNNLTSTLQKLSESAKRRWKNLTLEERTKLGKKMSAGRTPEQWTEILARINKAQSDNPERKRQQLQDNWNSKTPEEQKAIIQRMTRNTTPEQNRALALRMTASLTPQQRHDKAIKAWDTRRLKAARKILLQLVYSRIDNSAAPQEIQTSSQQDPTNPQIPDSEHVLYQPSDEWDEAHAPLRCEPISPP